MPDLKLDGDVKLIARKSAAQGLDASREGRLSREGLAAGGARTVILHRDPQIDRNGLEVSARISAIASLIAEGFKPCAPNDPSPPKLETAADSLCEDKPPKGP